MKKIILSLLIFLGILFGNNGAFAEGNYKGQPVFKIYNYSYDKGNKMYYTQSYGSAVYLGDNVIITNNHVVEDEKGGYTGFYEVCETIDFKKLPVCFSSAQLLYVDTTKDLAVLKLEKNPKTAKKIKFSDKKISIGDKVETYGYPSNGGDTVTFTSGKISGFETGRYKIDANIDSGSSGGGAFDNDGNLVGLTTSVVSGYTTLGYLVPVSDIKNFLLKKGNITNINKFDISKFKNFLEKYEKRINSDEISTAYIDMKNISKYGFRISENIFDETDEFNKNFLVSKTGYTVVSIGTNIVNTKKSKFTREDYKKLRNLLGLKPITEQIIYNNGKEYYYSLSLNKKTKEIKITFSRFAVKYEISGYLEEKDEIKNAILLLFKDSKIKPTINYNDTLFVDGVKFNKNSGFELSKYLGNNLSPTIYGLKKIGENTILQLVTKNLKFIKLNNTPTLNQILERNKKILSGKGVYYDTFINNKGKLFYYVKIKSSNFILYRFITEADFDGYWYNYSFYIYVYGNENVDSSIKQFINNLDFEGKEFFSKEEIKKAGIKNISEITFKNNLSENIDLGDGMTANVSINYSANIKPDISKKEAFEILKKLVGNSINFSNIENKNTNYFKYKQSVQNLLKIKNGKKYIEKIEKFIPKLKTEKLIKVSKKLEKIDFNNSKYKKYKLILEYIKYRILYELDERK